MNATIKPINQWPASLRPREKLLEEGPESVSDAELLAILLRSGNQGSDAVILARDMLIRFGGWRGLLGAGKEPLFEFKGLGPAKIATLLAAVEIGRRHLRAKVIGQVYLRDPESVMDYLGYDLRDRRREIFKVLFLDKSNRILAEKNLFEGTVDETAVHPREVIREAIRRHAVGVVLVHNHPSGRTEPSTEDRELTRRLQKICEGISVKVLDHLIIGENGFFSFRENGLLW